MTELFLFTDGSVNPQSKIGYGACLLLSQTDLIADKLDINKIKTQLKVNKVENTSSTKLELQTLLWSLENMQLTAQKLTIYTDSQNIIGLPSRRIQLEKNDYHTSKNKLINNHDLYRLFYKMIDQVDITFVKVKGHKVSGQKNNIDKLFTLVDRASRNALRASQSTA